MAQQMLNLGGNLPPEELLKQQQILRQQQMAQMLMQQGQQVPQGQMVSGRYVAPSFTQSLAGLANVYLGKKGLEKAEEEQLKMAERLREREGQSVKEYFQALEGTPAQPVPRGYELGDAGTPATGPNYQKALQIATNPYAPSWLKSQAVEMLKPQKLGEGDVLTRINPRTGQMETIASGGEKYRAPITIDTGTSTILLDPRTNQPIGQFGKSTAGQVVEREDGTFLVDTRTGQAKPVVGPQGQSLVGGKPLTETQSNAVAFGMRAVESNKIATDLENKGVANTGVIRTVLGGTVSGTPIIGEKLEQNVRSTFNVLPEFAGGPSPEQQQNDQARRNFISAVLRKESGAAISPTEYVNEERKYFPQLGDSDKVIKQKQDARKLAIQALEAQAGPSGKRLIEKGRELSPQDQEALNWANSNPTDPRSAQIKQRLGK